jgi:hypothetical protein
VEAFSTTENADALAEPESLGITHNEVSVPSYAGGRYPGPWSDVATSDVFVRTGMGAWDASVAAFGPTAVSSTSGGATALSASEAVPLAAPKGTPGTSRAVELASFDPVTLKGVGATKSVMLSSWGANHLPGTAFAQSDIGEGPHAFAIAGEATAIAYASNDNPPATVSEAEASRRRRRRRRLAQWPARRRRRRRLLGVLAGWSP